MTRAQLLAISLVAGTVIGGISIAAEALLGGTAGILVTLLVAYVALRVLTGLVITRRLPLRLRAVLEARVDPDAGPPADAAPIELGVAARLVEAVNARDWLGFGRLLNANLRLTSATDKRVHGRRMYVFAARQAVRAYPDLHMAVDEVVAQADAPGVAWVRLTETGTPRSGPPLDVTWWERWTLDDSGERLSEVHLAGVVRMS